VTPRLWVVSELYYPEETSTGYFLTQIAEGLARDFPVSVLCSQPTYSSRGQRAPARETRHGVDIHRCRGTVLDKDVLPFRLLNAVTITVSVFVKALAAFRRRDVVLVVTNPPFLPFLVHLAAVLRGARSLLLIHDVYPEGLVAAGFTGRRSALAAGLTWITRALYRSVDGIVVIGRDMKALVRKKLAGAATPVSVIPNWSDTHDVAPSPRATNPLLARLGLLDAFVVLYSGNMGRTHDLESALAAAEALPGEAHFIFMGWGAKRAMLERAAPGRPNVTVHPPVPRAELSTSLGACDVALISFVADMAGVSVPSRMYNVLAAGRPILAVADADSELAMLVREAGIGWVVAPGDSAGLVRAVREARSDPARLARMGAEARRLAEETHTLAAALDRYRALLTDMGLAPSVSSTAAAARARAS
jgi:colanic acid biosynthesis glycosyl transferase WcaI